MMHTNPPGKPPSKPRLCEWQVASCEAAAALRFWEQGDEAMYHCRQLELRFRNRTHPDVLAELHKWWLIVQRWSKRVEQQRSPCIGASQSEEEAQQPPPQQQQGGSGGGGDGGGDGGGGGKAGSGGAISRKTAPGKLSLLKLQRQGTLAVFSAVVMTRAALLPQASHERLCVLIIRALLEEEESWDEAEAMRLARSAWHSDTHGRGRLSRTLFNDAIFELAGA